MEIDRLCFQFLKTELQAYSEAARVAAKQHRAGSFQAARRSQALAEMGYAILRRYMSQFGHLIEKQHSELERSMEELRKILDQLQKGRSVVITAAAAHPSDLALITPSVVVLDVANRPLDKSAVAVLAYFMWLERGCPAGSPDEDWFRAEAKLRAVLN